MTYNPDIPKPNDVISNSQSQILDNFTALNNIYGVNGDHYSWDNATGTEQNRHAKVTLPALPTPNAPGNAVPTPAAADGVIYTKSVSSQTIPYYRKNSGMVDFPLLPVRAMGRFTTSTGAAIGTAFNLSGAAAVGTTMAFTFTEHMPDPNYLVLITEFKEGTTSSVAVRLTPAPATTGFTIGTTVNFPTQVAIAVLHYL